jgi:hypothetical protein
MSLLMQNDSQPELSSSFNSLVVFLLTDLGFLGASLYLKNKRDRYVLVLRNALGRIFNTARSRPFKPQFPSP